jgi:hypothetical protein
VNLVVCSGCLLSALDTDNQQWIDVLRGLLLLYPDVENPWSRHPYKIRMRDINFAAVRKPHVKLLERNVAQPLPNLFQHKLILLKKAACGNR